MKRSPATIWLDAIWASDLPTNSKCIAAFLRKHLHRQKYSCFPSVQTICEGCSMGKTSVHKYLNILLEKNWIARESGFKGKSNNYLILFENINSPPNERDSSHDNSNSPPDEQSEFAARTLITNIKTNIKNNEERKVKKDIVTRHFDSSWSEGIEIADNYDGGLISLRSLKR